MFATLFSSVLGKAVGATVAIALIVGAYAWITTAAYSRGYAKAETEITARMTAVIKAKEAKAMENQSRWRRATPTEKTAELQRRCVAACQQEPLCEKACRE